MLTKYEEKLQDIKNELHNMGSAVLEAAKIAHSAIQDENPDAFNEARDLLKNINDISADIDNKIVTTLALFSPEATDLREMVSYLKITNEFIRAAANVRSLSKNIKQKIGSDSDIDTQKIKEFAAPLQKCAIVALENAVAMIKCDCEDDELEKHYKTVMVEESKTDDLYVILEKNIMTVVCNNYELSRDYLDTLSALRKLEKVADRALSVASLLMFAEIGGKIK